MLDCFCYVRFSLKGIKAIYSPNTGIVDWGFVAKHYGKVFNEKGGTIHLGFEVDKFSESSDPNYPLAIVAKNEVNKLKQAKFKYQI